MRCCGSGLWSKRVAEKRPFASIEQLKADSDAVWALCGEADYLEAFSHHPKIGDVSELEKKFASTAKWSEGEQGSAVGTADARVLQALKEGNDAYDDKFGFIFIVCATGKSAAEMLALLNARLPNDQATELQNAAEEQRKITHLRLAKLFDE